MSTTTVLPFAGGELSSLDALGVGVLEQTSAGIYPTPFDSTVSRCAIAVPGGSNPGMSTPLWAAQADFWFHAYQQWQGGSDQGTAIRFYDGATIVLEARYDTSNNCNIYTLQSSVLTHVGSVALSAPANFALDIRLQAGASATCAAYLNGTNIFTATGLDHTDFTGVTQVVLRGTSGGQTVFWSQVICDAQPHIGNKLVTIAEDTASGVNIGWTGAVANINEIQLDDSHSVTSDTAGQVSTYYKAGASLGSWNVVAICVGARAQLTTGSPTNLQICLRTNGTNYFGPTTALDFGFAAVCASWTQNPFTASNWDTATAAAVETGMKSIA